MNEALKDIVSITEHCRDLGLSRSRYYQLVRLGVFLPPVYDIQTKQPCMPLEIQSKNLEARRRNCGVNGKPILFYAKTVGVPTSPTKACSAAPKVDAKIQELVESLGALNLHVSSAQVQEAVKEVFRDGIKEIDGETIKRLFIHIRQKNRRNSADNVGG